MVFGLPRSSTPSTNRITYHDPSTPFTCSSAPSSRTALVSSLPPSVEDATSSGRDPTFADDVVSGVDHETPTLQITSDTKKRYFLVTVGYVDSDKGRRIAKRFILTSTRPCYEDPDCREFISERELVKTMTVLQESFVREANKRLAPNRSVMDYGDSQHKTDAGKSYFCEVAHRSNEDFLLQLCLRVK